MKKITILMIATMLLSGVTFAQAEKAKLYNPKADAASDIAAAVEKAGKEGKHVLLQLGGNWCSWCIAFDKKVKETPTLKAAADKNFVSYHLNYSRENYNDAILADLGYPQRFGFPVFVILDGKGNKIHTQNSAYLEEGNGHSEKKVLEFFKQWGPEALKAENYSRKKKSSK